LSAGLLLTACASVKLDEVDLASESEAGVDVEAEVRYHFGGKTYPTSAPVYGLFYPHVTPSQLLDAARKTLARPPAERFDPICWTP